MNLMKKNQLSNYKNMFESFVRYTNPELIRPMTDKEWEWANREVDIEEENKILSSRSDSKERAKRSNKLTV